MGVDLILYRSLSEPISVWTDLCLCQSVCVLSALERSSRIDFTEFDLKRINEFHTYDLCEDSQVTTFGEFLKSSENPLYRKDLRALLL